VTEAQALPAARRRAPGTPFIVAALVAASVAYLAWHLGRGWIPHDDGALALSAERVMRGELPHRDFDEIYTGGLAYLDALAFGLLGTTLISLRWELLAVFAAWIPALFFVARKFLPPVAAAGVALLAVTWSVPNYHVPMPSWYNLFLATFGLAALLRHVDDPRARWLFAAGLCGGLSFLVKSIGLYYVAGAALFLVLRAHRMACEAGGNPRRSVMYPAFVSVMTACFVAALVVLVHTQAGPSEIFHHVLPGVLLAGWLIREEWAACGAGDSARFAALLRLLGPFVAGLALPIALFLVPYAMSGSIGAFLHGVFVAPTLRLGFATFPMPPLWTALAVLPLAALMFGARGIQVRARDAAVLAIAAGAIVLASGDYDGVYRFVWWSMRNALPVIAAATAWLLLTSRADAPAEQRLFAVVAVAATCSLVQFPFGIDIYFCYVAPLVILAGAALATRLRVAPAVLAILIVFYAGFALFRLNTASIYYLGARYSPYPEVQPLQAQRARGIRVEQRHAYVDRIAALLQEHGKGRFIWASPDSPHLYFLAGFSNPTRSLFEFLDEAPMDDAATLRMLEERGITAVALNTRPQFSPPMRASLYRELVGRYPHSEDAGPYQVRWRE
jgi:hypothetical protein